MAQAEGAGVMGDDHNAIVLRLMIEAMIQRMKGV